MTALYNYSSINFKGMERGEGREGEGEGRWRRQMRDKEGGERKYGKRV